MYVSKCFTFPWTDFCTWKPCIWSCGSAMKWNACKMARVGQVLVFLYYTSLHTTTKKVHHCNGLALLVHKFGQHSAKGGWTLKLQDLGFIHKTQLPSLWPPFLYEKPIFIKLLRRVQDNKGCTITSALILCAPPHNIKTNGEQWPCVDNSHACGLPPPET